MRTPRKMTRSSSEGVRFLWSFISYVSFSRRGGGNSQKSSKENLIICSKISRFFSFQNFLDRFEDTHWNWTLQKISSNLLRMFVKIWLEKKFSIFSFRGGSSQIKLPKILPSFDRAPQNKWSPRNSPQLSDHTIFYTIYKEKSFCPLLCQSPQKRILDFWTSGP